MRSVIFLQKKKEASVSCLVISSDRSYKKVISIVQTSIKSVDSKRANLVKIICNGKTTFLIVES
jgi:hypothetical protein